MSLTETEIEHLDKVIYGLSTSKQDTVPEILNGYNQFPASPSPEELMYQYYENILIENGICSIKDDWHPNSVISGFKSLQLEHQGTTLVYQRKSVRDFLKERKQRESDRQASIYVGGNAVIGNNNKDISQGRELNNLSPSIKNTPQENQPKKSAEKSNHTMWDKIKYVSGIIAGLGGIAGVIVGLAKYFHWW